MVKLHREHAARLENGFYIGRLMHAIRKEVIKNTRKPFTLDPVLANLQDLSSKVSTEFNWNLISAGLKKFNLKLSKEKKN